MGSACRRFFNITTSDTTLLMPGLFPNKKYMKIAIIGHGNVGGTLAKRWAEAGHQVVIGARNPTDDKVINLIHGEKRISASAMKDAVSGAAVILIATPAKAVPEVAQSIGDASHAIIIDATNAVFNKPEGFENGTEALQKLTNAIGVVKCFNTTGYENMENPDYGDLKTDMFMAGDSKEAKEMARQLAQDAGFGEVYDFGGIDKVPLLESFALAWINMAIAQNYGRGIAFKVLKR